MTFGAKFREQALAARRRMIRSGELLPEREFVERLGVGPARFARLIANGSLFSIEINGVAYFPALFTSREIDQRRLRSICRILEPGEAVSRYHYLTSRRANLGGISPIEAMGNDAQYRQLRRMASAWAIEWSRTSVSIYAGQHEKPPVDIEPSITVAADADPRADIWKRAARALKARGFAYPGGPYPLANIMTTFVVRHTAGESTDVVEARMHVSTDGKAANAFFVRGDEQGYEVGPVPMNASDSVVAVLLRIIRAAASKRRASGEQTSR